MCVKHHCIEILKPSHERWISAELLPERIAEVMGRVGRDDQDARPHGRDLDRQATSRCCLPDATLRQTGGAQVLSMRLRCLQTGKILHMVSKQNSPEYCNGNAVRIHSAEGKAVSEGPGLTGRLAGPGGGFARA